MTSRDWVRGLQCCLRLSTPKVIWHQARLFGGTSPTTSPISRPGSSFRTSPATPTKPNIAGFDSRHPFHLYPISFVSIEGDTMDFSSLKEQVSNLTLYDIKAGVRKVQNGTFRQALFLHITIGGRQKYWRAKLDSCHELYGNGGQGPRSYEQWAMGRIVNVDAGDCEWNT